LGIAFAVLIAILVGTGELGLRRMKEVDDTLRDITGRRVNNVRLVREAMTLSNRNSRITMELFLLQDRAQIGMLLAERSENTKEISALVAEIQGRCELEKEKRLLAAVEEARKPYVESYLRALHLLVDKRKHEAAVAVMVNETLPALLKYHAAWDDFVAFQKTQLDMVAKQSEVDYAKSRHLASLLIALAVAVALGIAVFITKQAQIIYRQEARAREGVEGELQRSEERMRIAMKAAKVGCWDLDVIKDEHVWSDTCKALLGVAADSPANYQSLMNAVHPDDQKTMQEQINAAIQEKREYGLEFRVVWPDGSVHWRTSSGQAFYDDTGRVTRMSGITMDIDDRKQAEERVQFLAYYDALTGLPNRTLLQDRLAKAFAGARRQKYKVALLFLDLDRFKDINDSLGHSVGDLLLEEVAGRLKAWGREQDTVARVGGDEFLIVLTGLKDVMDVAVAAERLMDAMTAEFVVQGRSLSIGCSVGISIFPEHGTEADDLIKNADAAMYCAKGAGRNNFRFYTENMNAQAAERLTLENNLRLALDNKELFLVYQPQMDMATGRITGLEALLRWQHPELGLVPPDKFIRIAENSGLIVRIGEWVLRTACSQTRKWQDEGLANVSVAVNVSAVQFRQEDFCELIRRVLQETGLAPQYLELELTESLLLSSADVTFSVLQKLKGMGLKLAIDDFGTGYSSFSYLRQFRVSKIKIDRSFVRDVAVNPDDAAITAAIISMAKSLNLKVIAEGVENEAQMSFLRAHQCDEIQGYYFSKPLAVDKIADKLRGDNPEPHVRAHSSGGQS
jgi:diguanylate cyclase (GGDEF)-like protein/PAS domain S-box-containing protein